MRILRLVSVITLLTALPASAAQQYGNVIVSEITSIYDGDTFRANIERWPGIIGHRVPIRINGIDTPELRGQCQQEKVLAKEAKKVTVSVLRAASKVELRNMKRGKYFRIVSDVYADGMNVGEQLIGRGLAVRYGGGKKIKDWCK